MSDKLTDEEIKLLGALELRAYEICQERGNVIAPIFYEADMMALLKGILALRSQVARLKKIETAAKTLAEYPDYRVGGDFQSNDGGKNWGYITIERQCPFCMHDLKTDNHHELCDWMALRAALSGKE